jgi:hypothetical protein
LFFRDRTHTCGSGGGRAPAAIARALPGGRWRAPSWRETARVRAFSGFLMLAVGLGVPALATVGVAVLTLFGAR